MASDYPILDGSFEIRARGGGRLLSGRFLYNATATVRSAGRVRKERFASGSMSWQVREFEKLQAELSQVMQSAVDRARIEALQDAVEKRNTCLLVGYDYNRSIADMHRRPEGTATGRRTPKSAERADHPLRPWCPGWASSRA